MSLYQKYRPKDFDDLVGQSFLKTSLKNALKQDILHHGYMFNGSHGIGKTSIARIFAKALNCTALQESGNPCDTCENCTSFNSGSMIDVIEIDAASNTGVDNIRDLIEKAQFMPNQGRYKIYIIDEVHMLSKGAFNALLKTLEEPPHHVVFMLATTELHKIPETILSRVLRYDLKKFSISDLSDRLEFICKNESISYDRDGLELIARFARGGMRDAISLTEQYSHFGDIKQSTIISHLGLVDEKTIADFFRSIHTCDLEGVEKIFTGVREGSIDISRLIDQMLHELHEYGKKTFGTEAFTKYNDTFFRVHELSNTIKRSPHPVIFFESSIRSWMSEYSDTGK